MGVTHKKLSAKAVAAFCAANAGWRTSSTGAFLQKSFETKRYIDGLMLVTRIAIHAEIKGHHPDLTLSYSTVKVRLQTHDAGGVTTLDTDLAHIIDDVAQR